MTRAWYLRCLAVAFFVQIPLAVLLMASTGSDRIFSIIFLWSAAFEVVVISIVSFASFRRVADSGGSVLVPLGLVSSASVLFLAQVSSHFDMGLMNIVPGDRIYSVISWSFSGFLFCFLIFAMGPRMSEKSGLKHQHHVKMFGSNGGEKIN